MSPLSIELLVATLPVTLFLLILVYLDSYKLVAFRSILGAMAVGTLVAATALAANLGLLSLLSLDTSVYSKTLAPPVEEALKALPLIFLIRTRRVGFLVDAAIYGFAIGTGFAVVENILYYHSLPGSQMPVWIIRGFGTAVMHGGATALCAILAKLFAELKSSERIPIFLPGLAAAAAVHALYNNFLFSPVVSAAGILILLPPLLYGVFSKSERTLQDWLGVGFDTDVELLRLLHSGEFPDSRTGRYLQALRDHFKGEVVADMLCYLRLHLELAIRAKGAFLMLESGFPVELDKETVSSFEELKYLEGQIGKTGRKAMAPFLSARSHDFWQLSRLRSSG